MTADQQDRSDPIVPAPVVPATHAAIPADPLAAVEAIGEAALEPWQYGLALGTAWWNAAIGLWWPLPPVSHHHAETLPPALERDEPALFA